MITLSKRMAKNLLEIKAVFFRPDEPFIWASGIKSPIYCDNRLTLTSVKVRAEVEIGLAGLIEEHYPECEVLMGTSTAGIAHAAITAHILGLPMGYVRSEAKDHGKKNKIEGKLEPGKKVVVIEDLISTASSVIDTVQTLREAGAQVLGIASIFTYSMDAAKKKLDEAGVKNASLTDIDTAVAEAERMGYITSRQAERILTFRDNPGDESWVK